MENKSILEAKQFYLEHLYDAGKSRRTIKTYDHGLIYFIRLLEKNSIDINGSVEQLSETVYNLMLKSMGNYSHSTKCLYTTAVTDFYVYLFSMEWIDVNIVRIIGLRKSTFTNVSPQMPLFSEENIKRLIDYAQSLDTLPTDIHEERLRNYRDKALIITLVDTGLLIHEACNLKRGSINFADEHIVFWDHKNQEVKIRLTTRSINAIQDYLRLRSSLDDNLGNQLDSLPLFMRHDHPIGKVNKNFRLKNLSTETGRDIVNQRVSECLGPEEIGNITPYSLRHYFISNVLKITNNIYTAQKLARHSELNTTAKYSQVSEDELDEAYKDAFEK